MINISRNASDITGNHYEFLVSGMMLVVFLNASAVSSIVIYNFRKRKPNFWQPRKAATLGWAGPYDGNVIGGALLGAGMTLTGACPGTLLPQLAAGVPSKKYVLGGGLLGGIIYSKVRTHIHRSSGPQANIAMAKRPVYERMDMREVNGVSLFMVFYFAVAEGAKAIFLGQGELLSRAALGGYGVDASQALSMYLTGNTLGVSAAYEQFGDCFWRLLSLGSNKLPDSKKLAFPVGSVIGALFYKTVVNIPAPAAVNIGALKAIIGGMMLIIGGRVGGGCTSGHGISGMSMLSMASFVSVASIFGTGVLVAFLMG